MADSFAFDLVAPERRLASFAAKAVQIPGAEGDLTALPGHMPLVTTLRPGIIEAQGDKGNEAFVVIQGFAEVTPEGVTIIAERAYPRDEVSREEIEALLKEAQEKAASCPEEEKDVADKLVADIAHLLEMMV